MARVPTLRVALVIVATLVLGFGSSSSPAKAHASGWCGHSAKTGQRWLDTFEHSHNHYGSGYNVHVHHIMHAYDANDNGVYVTEYESHYGCGDAYTGCFNECGPWSVPNLDHPEGIPDDCALGC